MKPGTSGTTMGRNSSDTKHRASSVCDDVNGSRAKSSGGVIARSQQFRERPLRHRLLVIGNRQAAFRHVKHALGRAPVALGIVQHALLHAIRREDVRRENVLVRRQRQRARHARAVEHERATRQLRREAGLVEIIVEELLDAPIRRAKIIGQQPLRFALMLEQRRHQFLELRILRALAVGKPSAASFRLMYCQSFFSESGMARNALMFKSMGIATVPVSQSASRRLDVARE